MEKSRPLIKSTCSTMQNKLKFYDDVMQLQTQICNHETRHFEMFEGFGDKSIITDAIMKQFDQNACLTNDVDAHAFI